MRVIEQLARHFWERGQLTQNEARYLVEHGFAPPAAFPGLAARARPRPREVEIPPEDYEAFDGHEEYSGREGAGPCDLEVLQDSLAGLRPGVGPRRGRRRKSVRRKLVVLRALVARCFAGQNACPTVLALGSRVRPCGGWVEALCAIVRRGHRKEGLALLRAHPEAVRELAECLSPGAVVVARARAKGMYAGVPEVARLRLVCRVREALGIRSW